MNVIFRTDKQSWYSAALAKRDLAFYRARNKRGKFNEAIKKEEEILRSFTDRAA